MARARPSPSTGPVSIVVLKVVDDTIQCGLQNDEQIPATAPDIPAMGYRYTYTEARYTKPQAAKAVVLHHRLRHQVEGRYVFMKR